MPTLPPSRTPAEPQQADPDASTGRPVHAHRELAQSFGSDPERYDRTRPAYPDALIERIVADSPGRDMLDVGCGTGIAARQLQAAGATALGIEPDGSFTIAYATVAVTATRTRTATQPDRMR